MKIVLFLHQELILTNILCMQFVFQLNDYVHAFPLHPCVTHNT